MKDFYVPQNNIIKYSNISSRCVVSGNIKSPVISIFIPTYKRPDTIIETIESALTQHGETDYEIVIVNNDQENSDESVKRAIQSYNDTKLYYYVNEKNIGLCGNWNRGLELCRARYVTMIHDDDVLSPWFLQSILKAIYENDYPQILGVKQLVFDSSNKPDFRVQKNLAYRQVTKRSFFFGRYITIAGMTVDREYVLELGGYNEDYYPNEDTIMIYQALLTGRVIEVSNYLAGYRKERNLSLSDGTMEETIRKMEQTRRCIAQHELFARIWMWLFDKEYLYKYVRGANDYWGTKVDAIKLFSEFGLGVKEPNRFKMNIMNKLIQRLSQ